MNVAGLRAFAGDRGPAGQQTASLLSVGGPRLDGTRYSSLPPLPEAALRAREPAVRAWERPSST